MLAALIIVFREAIEAGLVIGIVMAVTRGIHNRGLWISAGIAAGIAGSLLVAVFADSLSNMMAGSGQEVFNAAILFIAVLMLTAHNVWMARTGRQMASDMKLLGEAVSSGQRTLTALVIVIGVAILREGSEVVLFLYGIALSGDNSIASMFLGGAIGLLLGACVSALMYFGLLRIPSRYLFSVTTFLIALLAAGMAAQAILYLEQAGLVNVLSSVVWDTSGLISAGSLGGKALHTLVGYADRPTGIQLFVYVSTLVVMFTLMRLFGRKSIPQKAASEAV